MDKTGFGVGLKYRSGEGMEMPGKTAPGTVGTRARELGWRWGGGVLERGSERWGGVWHLYKPRGISNIERDAKTQEEKAVIPGKHRKSQVDRGPRGIGWTSPALQQSNPFCLELSGSRQRHMESCRDVCKQPVAWGEVYSCSVLSLFTFL